MKKYSYAEPGRLALPAQLATDTEPAKPAEAVAFTVEFYESIYELPMRRLNEFNIHLAQDSGIGSTLADWDERMAGVDVALSSGSLENTMRERYNSRLGLYLLFEHINTKARALADVVYAVNGQSVASNTEDEMMEVHHLLSMWMSDAQAREVADELKKKFNSELAVAFPGLFPDTEEVEFYINLIKRARLQLNSALHDAEVDEAMEEVNRWLASQMKPANFDFSDTNNAVEAGRRNFAKIVAGLAMRGVHDAGALSAYQFHAAIQVIKDNAPKPVTQ